MGKARNSYFGLLVIDQEAAVRMILNPKRFGLVVCLSIGLSLCVDPNCKPGDPTCSAFYGPPQDTTPVKVIVLEDTAAAANKKFILLPDAIENASSPDVEFRLFQQKVLNFSELGALKVLESQTLPSIGVWAVRIDPASPWLNSTNSNLELGEFSSVRLQGIKNPGLAQLTLVTTNQGPNPAQQTVLLYKFVMPLPLAARLQLKVEPSKIFSMSGPSETMNTPFVMAQDIFTVTLGAMAANNVMQDALPQSKTLEKKVSDFLYAATATPKDFDPGVYLKPKAGYGLIATLEFRIYSDAGNSTKILYEQGDVYLHGRDRLRFVPKAPPPASPAMPPVSGDLTFHVRCWDGTSTTEAALGPTGELRINFDNFLGRRPQLKQNATAAMPGGQLPKVIATVPYKLDTDTQYQTGFSVGDLADWFFSAPTQSGNVPDWQPWTMSVGVIATGTGELGDWQYKDAGGWHNFLDNLKTGWKLFSADQQSKSATNGGYATTFSMVDLKQGTQVQVVLISPKLTIRFKPSKDQCFWSATDAFRQTSFSFLGWKPNNASAGADVIVAAVDPPDCKVCNDMGISKDGVTICAERYGCDGKISSMIQADQCDVCGGSNECVDCRHVPRGKAKWVCGVCTEDDGSSLKDCRGVCNGTYQRTSSGDCVDPFNDPKGCDGEYRSSAITNECGACVLGRTGKPLNYSKDQCGVCNGSNACIGCDGQPNSGKVLDICGLCRHPKDDSFNKGCGARMSDVCPKVANVVNATTRVNATGLSLTTQVDCWLTLVSRFLDSGTSDSAAASSGNVTLNVSSRASSVNSTSDLTILALHWDYADTPGVYCLRCKAAHTFEIAPAENGSLIYLVDYNLLQLSSVEPNSIILGDSGQSMMVNVAGVFVPTITRDPYCLGQDKKTKESFNFPSEIRNSKEATCNLASVTKSKALELRVVQHPDQLLDITSRQRPVAVTVKAKAPKVLSAKFGDAALEIVATFDVNVMASGDCQQIFDDAVAANLGNQPSCKFSADQLHVTLGSNHQMNVNDQIRFKQNSVHQADAEFYDYLSADVQTPVKGPDKKLVPAVSIDSPVTVAMCADQVHLSVRKASGDGGRAMSYQWTVAKAEKTSAKSTVSIPAELQQLAQAAQSDSLVIPVTILSSDVTYTLNIIACNFLKECSAPSELLLHVGNYTGSQMVVQILGLEPPVRCGSKRQLAADAAMKVCDTMKPLTSSLVFRWEVKVNQTVTATGNDWVFVLPTSDAEPGQQATVKVQAFYDQPHDRNFTAETSLTITFEAQPLWVRLGADTRKQGVAEDLVLDGSASYDPNKKVQKLQHSWTCRRLDAAAPNDPSRASPCYLKSNSGNAPLLEGKVNMNQAVVTIPANTFDTGVYTFTDTVRSGALQDNDSVTVTLVPGRVPLVEMLPSLSQKPSGDQPITFRTNVYSRENTTVTLSFVETQGFGNVTLPEDLRQRTRVDVPASAIGPGGYIFSFTLPPGQTAQYPNWAGLEPKTLYAARVAANTSSGLAGESFVSFRTNERPTMGTLTVSTIPADSVIYALTTVLRLEAKGFVDRADDLPLSYQFGIRTYTADGRQEDEWFPARQVEELDIRLASAESSHPTCNRVGYQALVKVCDLHGACAKAISPAQPFEVQQPVNLTAAIEDLVGEIQTDLADGNGFGACLKMAAIVAQKCGNLSRALEGATQAVTAHVLGRLTPTSDKDDLVAATQVANDLLLRPDASVTDGVLVKLRQVLQRLEASVGISESKNTTATATAVGKKRKKRQASLAAGSQAPVDAESATQILGAYEIIVTHAKDVDSVAAYLKGTQDLLNQMCLGRDATRAPMIASSKGSSQPLCVVKAQGLFIDQSIINKNHSIAALDPETAAQLQIGSGLEETYTLWSCNSGKSTCTSVCLATAAYFVSTDAGTTPVGEYMFQNGSLTALSDVHWAQFVDPISKETLSIKRPDWERYVLLLPLVRTGPTGSYACKMYITSAQDWSSNYCEMVGAKTMSNGKKYVGCQCRSFGYVAVFEAQTRSAPSISPSQAVSVSFIVDNLDSSKVSDKEDQLNATRQALADRMNTSMKRIAGLEIKKPSMDVFGAISSSDSQKLLSFKLRPPSRFDWTETSQLLFRINNTASDQIQVTSPTLSFQIVPGTLIYLPVKRDLKNDFNSRMITMKILNDYDETVTKNGIGALTSTLTTQLAVAMNVSRMRITDMSFAKGSTILIFIVQSVSPKSSEPSSEEAAWVLVDQIRYEELALTDTFANALTVDWNGTSVKELERKPTQAPSDSLPVIIGGTVGAAFFVVIVFVLALVAIKSRGRRDKVSPFTTPTSSPDGSQRNSAQTTVNVRRISITEDQSGSSLRSRRR